MLNDPGYAIILTYKSNFDGALMSVFWMSSVIDWDTCKIQHEVLGDSLERVAITHGIQLESVKRIAEDEGWTPLKPTAANLNTYLSDILDSHRAKLALAALYRDMELFPKVVLAENALLEKIMAAIGLIDPGEPKAAAALKALGQGLNAIADRQLHDTGPDADDGELPEDLNWTVEVKKAEKQADDIIGKSPESD